jgi:pantothenate kinase
MMDTFNTNVAEVLQLITNKGIGHHRLVIGVAGPPGSGKSTLAESVVNALNQLEGDLYKAALLPMDGFHYDNELLEARNLSARKGAPETFDIDGLTSLLVRVHQAKDSVPYPLFDRTLDRSLMDAGTLDKSVNVVVVEGNYLLLKAPKWEALKGLFDTSVFLTPSLDTLEDRLLQRWLDHGFTMDKALAKVHGNDLLNAQLVLNSSATADLTLSD